MSFAVASVDRRLERSRPAMAGLLGAIANWHPFLADTLRQMADDGVRRALAFVTSAFGCYSSCRQYREDIEAARSAVGPDAPQIDKLRLFFNHPGLVEPTAQRLMSALARLAEGPRSRARVVFTAHSIPTAMAQTCDYEKQLREACHLVAAEVGRPQWDLVYHSRSGPPQQPWLGPDIQDYLRTLHATERVAEVVVVPIGFLCEHMEVIYDLDVEASALCLELGITMVRAATVGTHPRYVQMIRELILERIDPNAPRLALGTLGPSPDICPADCCRCDVAPR